MKKFLVSITCIFFLYSCATTNDATQNDTNNVISTVASYEEALKSYNSKNTIKYLSSICILGQYGSVEEYHRVMQRAFAAIQRDGGIKMISKGNVSIIGNNAYVESIIETNKAKQTGIVELRKENGLWLISKLP